MKEGFNVRNGNSLKAFGDCDGRDPANGRRWLMEGLFSALFHGPERMGDGQMASKTESLAGLEAKARALAEQMGYELVDVRMDKEPTGTYLRFYIDKEEGVSLDDCEAFHKAVRTPADSVDFDFMEVSSPGIDRPLKKDRDFERNLGCEIEVKLFKPIDGTKVITGVLAGLEEGNIVIDTGEGRMLVPRKAAALVKPVVDMEGIEDVDLSGDDENNTET